MKLLLLIPFLFASCESATQTAIRENQPPAVAYIVRPELIETRAIIVPAP
jgi:hypothetical protein